MLRAALIALFSLSSVAALAQDAGVASVDFVLRPTQSATDNPLDDMWGDAPPAPPATTATASPTTAGTNVAVTPEQARVKPAAPVQAAPTSSQSNRAAADPFAATGLALGPFVLRPALEVGVSATDNPAGTAKKRAAVGLVVAPELNLQTEDTRYKVEANLHAEEILYGDQQIDQRAADARVKAHYDLAGRTVLQAEAGYSYYLDRYNDPNTPAAAVQRPPVQQFDAKLGVTQGFGQLSVGVSGEAQREVHEDVALAGGGTASLKDLNNTEYGVRARTSYSLGSVLTPYVEAAVGRRDYDLSRDSDGLKRSGVWGELRGGLAFDLGSKLKGDVAVGWRHEAPEDKRIGDIDALTAAAAVVWSPRRLTEVRFDLSTDVRPTSLPDSPGSVLYSSTLTGTRKLTSRVRLEAGLGLDVERFIDIGRVDTTWSGFTGVTYAFNRFASIQARYSYERTDSTDQTANEDANVIGMRVRLQH